MIPSVTYREDWSLYAAVLETRGYIVGEANAASGLHRLDGENGWTHLGWANLRQTGMALDPERPDTLYLSAGNGVLRSRDAGQTWRITTGWRITEVQDVALDRAQPGRIWAATAYGVFRSDDCGDRWMAASHGIPEPRATYIQTIEIDRARTDVLVAGSEEGLFITLDGAETWQPTGPRGVGVRIVRQSPHAANVWLAGTENRGLLISTDGAATWRPAGGALAGKTCYAVAFDPLGQARMAAAGFETGVYVSDDAGATWKLHVSDLPEPTVHALAFDPREPGRLWVGTVGRGVFCVDPNRAWTAAGLESAMVRDLKFARRRI